METIGSRICNAYMLNISRSSWRASYINCWISSMHIFFNCGKTKGLISLYALYNVPVKSLKCPPTLKKIARRDYPIQTYKNYFLCFWMAMHIARVMELYCWKNVRTTSLYVFIHSSNWVIPHSYTYICLTYSSIIRHYRFCCGMSVGLWFVYI